MGNMEQLTKGADERMAAKHRIRRLRGYYPPWKPLSLSRVPPIWEHSFTALQEGRKVWRGNYINDRHYRDP